MARLSTIIPIAAVVVLAGGAAGGWFVCTKTEAKQKAKREQAFADLSQCLFGERVEGAEEAASAITAMQARGGHLPQANRWVDQGVAWPQRCGTYAKDLVDATRDSSFIEEEAKRALMKDAAELGEELAKPDAQTGFLARPITALWKDAKTHGLTFASTSKVSNPPPKTERIGVTFDALEVPFVNLLPVMRGPQWHFLVTRKDKKDKLGSCIPSESGLACKEFESDFAFMPEGGWESPSFLPQVTDHSIRVLREGVLVDPGLPERARVYMDKSGTLFALAQAWDNDNKDAIEKLLIKPDGKDAKAINLGKLLDKRPNISKDAPLTADFIGQGLTVVTQVDGKEKKLRFPLSPEGALGDPIEIPKGPVCRAGSRYVFREIENKMITFLEGDKLGESLSLPSVEAATSRDFSCSASGSVQIDSRRLCRPKPVGCVEVLDKESFEVFKANVQHLPVIDTVGDRIVYTWGAKDGSGLLVHIGAPGFVATGRDVLVVDKTGGKGPQKMGVFGGEKLAIAIADVEGKLVAFMIKADGSVAPVPVTWN